MASNGEFTGPARLDRRTKRLTRRLKPGDVAIIDHRDIDRVSAEELLESGVRVVVNVAPSQTGRFPNPGPLLLVRGGVRLIDAPGAALFDELSDGEDVTIRGSSVFRNGTCLADGRSLGAEELARALVRAAETAQVITITHLPQIASVADRHFRVDKVPGDPTHTRISELDAAERKQELERMLGGAEFLATIAGTDNG